MRENQTHRFVDWGLLTWFKRLSSGCSRNGTGQLIRCLKNFESSAPLRGSSSKGCHFEVGNTGWPDDANRRSWRRAPSLAVEVRFSRGTLALVLGRVIQDLADRFVLVVCRQLSDLASEEGATGGQGLVGIQPLSDFVCLHRDLPLV